MYAYAIRMISGSMATSGVEIRVSLGFHYEVVETCVPASTRLLWIVHELHIFFCAVVVSESVCSSIGTEFVQVLWCWVMGARPIKFGKQTRGSTRIVSYLHNCFGPTLPNPQRPGVVFRWPTVEADSQLCWDARKDTGKKTRRGGAFSVAGGRHS